jgi:3-hydroxybutyryl-CoA dehydrogenase
MNESSTVGVVGCGTMGTGIAIVCARAGFVTRVYDQREDALNNAKNQAAAFLKKSVERGKLAAGEDARIMAQFSTTTSMTDLSDCDFIIENFRCF